MENLKSTEKQLQARGAICQEKLEQYEKMQTQELFAHLDSKIAWQRTMAVHRLGEILDKDDEKLIDILLPMLEKEKALYTKIEICQLLQQAGPKTCQKMIAYLGKIGDNQYKQVPSRISKKISYPLPRDIIARTMAKMNPVVFPTLLQLLETRQEDILVEGLDAIGFMVFYHPELASKENLEKIVSSCRKHSQDERIIWKCAMCFSAFPLQETQVVLEQLQKTVTNPTVQAEIQKSLDRIRGIEQ